MTAQRKRIDARRNEHTCRALGLGVSLVAPLPLHMDTETSFQGADRLSTHPGARASILGQRRAAAVRSQSRQVAGKEVSAGLGRDLVCHTSEGCPREPRFGGSGQRKSQNTARCALKQDRFDGFHTRSQRSGWLRSHSGRHAAGHAPRVKPWVSLPAPCDTAISRACRSVTRMLRITRGKAPRQGSVSLPAGTHCHHGRAT